MIGGELRGGAWVVIDPTINPQKMEVRTFCFYVAAFLFFCSVYVPFLFSTLFLSLLSVVC